jgi:hypothetical protein
LMFYVESLWLESYNREYRYEGYNGWSQWPRGLRRTRSWTVRTMGSWIWIPLEAWMCVRVFLCRAVLCRQRPCDRTDPQSKESY